MKFKPFLFIFLLLMAPASALAGGFCCQMPAGVEQNGLSGAGSISLSADYDYSSMSSFVEGDEYKSFDSIRREPRFIPVKAGAKAVLPNDMDMQRITLGASYQPTDRLVLSLTAPWIINNMTMTSITRGKSMNGMPGMLMVMKMKMSPVSYMGDMTFSGSYRIYQDQDTRPRTALWAGVGLKTPTGPSTVDDNGKRIHAHMQPGTGSWDPILSLNFIKMLSSDFLLKADASYHFSTPNRLDYSYGDTASMDTALAYNLTDFMNVSFGVNYFHSEQADDPDNKYNGKVRSRLTDYAGYTGEDSIWISPSFHIMPFAGAGIDFKFQYPVYYHVPDLEFVTDYRLTAGVSYSF